MYGRMALHPEARGGVTLDPQITTPSSVLSNGHLSVSCTMRVASKVARMRGWQDPGTKDSVQAILLLQLASTHLPCRRRHSVL